MTAGAAVQVVLAPALIFGLPGIHDGIGYTGSAWAFVISRFLTLLATAYVLARRGMIQAVGRLARSAAFVARGAAHRRAVDHDQPDRSGVDGRRVRTARQIRTRGGGRLRRGDTDRVARGDDSDGVVVEHFADGRAELGRGPAGTDRRCACGSATDSRSRGACSSFAVLAMFGRGIVGLINDDPAVIEATYHYLLIVPLRYSTMGVVDGRRAVVSLRSASRCRR